ncbi:hypothetical protein HYE67_009448 [Fusarium culmorum]|uniref:Uncharacterized protein n=1 Tax=Fusarium culmorum TaxID=5516 RepID=A0A2T4HBA5_FUSCU|nr:hypothetical protein FCULG_00004185 [Fusarium culmorum]QPC67217.1 hypothetical protein HYE67_009448 [Fusarium culmorum]
MYSPQYRKGGIRETTCAATGTICRNTTTNLRIDGHTFKSLYCQFHACRQIEAGRACAVAKPPSAIVCSQHSRCQAVDNGMGCALDVKDGNTAMHKYCIQLHLCGFSGCENERSKRNQQYIPFCVDHRCEQDNCRNSKDVGIFCRSHTCDDQYCVAFAPGIDLDDPQRFCERHRQCQKPQCPRLCHTRDDGQPSPFCGTHYCQAPDCEDGREAGLFCPEHTCAELGCLKVVIVHTTSACMMAVELRWWRADFAKSTDGAWSRALEEGFQLKGWDTLCMEMTSLIHAQASMTEEDVAEELNMAISSVNTIYVRSTIARLQGLDHPTSVSITGALQWDVMNPGRYNPKSGFEATPMGCSAKSMLVAMLVVKTKMLKIQTDARGTEEATCEDLDQGWNQKMRG